MQLVVATILHCDGGEWFEKWKKKKKKGQHHDEPSRIVLYIPEIINKIKHTHTIIVHKNDKKRDENSDHHYKGKVYHHHHHDGKVEHIHKHHGKSEHQHKHHGKSEHSHKHEGESKHLHKHKGTSEHKHDHHGHAEHEHKHHGHKDFSPLHAQRIFPKFPQVYRSQKHGHGFQSLHHYVHASSG
ncbi:uncharacterized protein [Halyomorpha halys]|uniref:uncharacterized protein n=1 Tax=Halyomorpha halys TaxID=286706 RepID=UPI0034D1B2B0